MITAGLCILAFVAGLLGGWIAANGVHLANQIEQSGDQQP